MRDSGASIAALIFIRDKGNINVLNKRIELLEKALQRQDERGSSTSSPEVGSGGHSVTIGDASPSHGYSRPPNHESVDVESTRTGEGMLWSMLWASGMGN